MLFKENDFLLLKSYTVPVVYSTLFERYDEYVNYLAASKYIAKPIIKEDEDDEGRPIDLSFFDILQHKKIDSQTRSMTEKQRLEDDLQKTIDGDLNEDLTEEANEVLQQINDQAKLKFLQMYYDAYMAPKVSDAKWRLGAVTGTVMDSALPDELGTIKDGSMYTRSNFAVPYNRRFWDGQQVTETQEFYTSLFFPPFKVGENSRYDQKTGFMNEIYRLNPYATFHQDNFVIKRDGFTYRDAGFKAINDYIHFLQWIAEGVTGVVSTYLTEWDLSLYMQEGLLTAQENGGPLKLFLNYRIEKDNPMSMADGKYTDNRSRVFNVAGSAVSKIEFDCQKMWRPSDHPLSNWWSPYTKDRHWKMRTYVIEEDEFNWLKIDYMDLYDLTRANFPYDASDTLAIMRQQDYIGTILGAHPNFFIKYYQAFYYNSGDFLSEFEIKAQGWLKKVAGAEPGTSAAMGKGLDDFIQLAKEEMILNGGYWGGPEPAGMSASGVMSRMAIQDAMNMKDEGSGGGGSGKTSLLAVMTKMKSDRSKGTSKGMAAADLNQVTSPEYNSPGIGIDSPNSPVADFMDAGMSNKADASVMAKFTGVNRHAPALFGGPHGADYSPNSLQGYFQADNTFLRNIPRLSSNNSDYFKSENRYDEVTDLNSPYQNSGSYGSHNTMLKRLAQGISNYVIEFGTHRVQKTEWIEGTIEYNPETNQFDKITFPPTRPDGSPITYSGNLKYETKVITRTDNPWDDDPNSWWYNYTSYMNIYNAQRQYQVGSEFYYDTAVTKVYRLGTYSYISISPYKKYLFHDMPDVNWEIVQHSFGDKEGDNTPSGSFWSFINSIKGEKNIGEKYGAMMRDNVFILKFYDDEETERQFLQYMMGINQGPNPAVSLIFCEGNEGSRYTQGPRSIFRATCRIKTYTHVTEQYKYVDVFAGWQHQGWWWHMPVYEQKLVHTGSTYQHVPYIDVDLSTVDFFEDMLQHNPMTNKANHGVDLPVHLKAIEIASSEEVYCADHPIEKFEQRFFDLIISYKTTQTEEHYSWNWGWGGWWWRWGWRGSWWGWRRPYVSYKEPTTITEENWISYASMGISGKGILSAVQGIDPNAQNIVVGGLNYPFRDLLSLPLNAKDSPIKSLPFKTHVMTSWASRKQTNSIGVDWWTNEGVPTYREVPMDIGLKRALANMYTRAKFYSLDNRYPTFVSLDFPVRNFLSIIITQVSYFHFFKDLLENIDFEVIHNALTACVDSCVIKANGMNADGELIDVDKSHVLYNYWMEQAIIIFGNKATYNETRNRLKTEVNNRINKYEYISEVLDKLCQRDVDSWTFNEICMCYNFIATLKEDSGKGIIDKFIFAYLHILYNYRFFFVAKRFNKEDGTMWIMRALESVLDYIVPYGSDNNPPPPVHKLKPQTPSYKVAFYELQNTTSAKHQALMRNYVLEEDRINKLYVKIKWVDKAAYDKWIEYSENRNTKIEVQEVVAVEYCADCQTPTVRRHTHNYVTRYAEKPNNGLYKLYSSEYLANDMDVKWNELNKDKIQRVVKDYDTMITQINWGDAPDLTPIRWDVFGNVNVDNLLEYSKASVSPEELICLIEEGADFWTVNIPQAQWPRATGYRSDIKLKLYREGIEDTLKNDPLITMLGPMAYSIYPILHQQGSPAPGLMTDVPDIFKHMSGSRTYT